MLHIFFTSFFLSIMIINITVSATSWVELKPQEVVDRAEVIVTGKYDFSSKPKPSDLVFQGLDFNVINVYKVDISKQLTAGIDYNDIGWAEEFQNEGGEFLLFLEKSKDADFLIPVGGPNGMVQVYNGKVEDPNYMKQESADHLTIAPDLYGKSFWLKAFISFFILVFGVFKRPWVANQDGNKKGGLGIGAFNLVKRRVYEEIGTHQSIKNRPDDDLQLGQTIKHTIFFIT